MAAPKIMSGARALVKFARPGQPAVVVAIFTSFSYGTTFDGQPAYTLGAYGPREIDYTSMEPVACSASGWRVVDHGPHVEPLFPTVQELMNHEYIQIVVVDRATKKNIATIDKVRPMSYGSSLTARQLTENSYNFMGCLMGDESASNDYREGGDAAVLP